MKDIANSFEFFKVYLPTDISRETLESLENPDPRIGFNYIKTNEQGEKSFLPYIEITSDNKSSIKTGKIPEEDLVEILPQYIYQPPNPTELKGEIKKRYDNFMETHTKSKIEKLKAEMRKKIRDSTTE
jgi:hypothetical protein